MMREEVEWRVVLGWEMVGWWEWYICCGLYGVSCMFEGSLVIGALLGWVLSISFAQDYFRGREKRALTKKID